MSKRTNWVYPWNEPFRSMVLAAPGAWQKLEELTESHSFYWWGSGLVNGGLVREEEFLKAIGKADGHELAFGRKVHRDE